MMRFVQGFAVGICLYSAALLVILLLKRRTNP